MKLFQFIFKKLFILKSFRSYYWPFFISLFPLPGIDEALRNERGRLGKGEWGRGAALGAFRSHTHVFTECVYMT